MFCKFCGNEIAENSKFCNFCGKAVEENSVEQTPVKKNDTIANSEYSDTKNITTPMAK